MFWTRQRNDKLSVAARMVFAKFNSCQHSFLITIPGLPENDSPFDGYNTWGEFQQFLGHCTVKKGEKMEL